VPGLVSPIVTPLVVPPGVTSVVLAETPPELLTLVSPVVPVETPVVVPVPPPPEVYVAPPHQRKQDRN